MTRIFGILTIFATIAAVCLSIPRQLNDLDIDDLALSIGDQKVGIPTEELIRALDSQLSNDNSMARGANFFNFSAYVNTNRPPNTTALTFVPLITLLLGIAQGAG